MASITKIPAEVLGSHFDKLFQAETNEYLPRGEHELTNDYINENFTGDEIKEPIQK